MFRLKKIAFYRGAIFLLLLSHFYGYAQNQDTIIPEGNRVIAVEDYTKEEAKRIKTATLWSAALPGAGQIYNKKYWKAPVAWALLGSSVYFIIDNNKNYEEFREAYKFRTDDDPNTTDKYEDVYSEQSLFNAALYYRKNRDLWIVGFAAIWAVNILDAHIDAQLLDFDVSENLSLNIEPQFSPKMGNQDGFGGIKLRLSFK